MRQIPPGLFNIEVHWTAKEPAALGSSIRLCGLCPPLLIGPLCDRSALGPSFYKQAQRHSWKLWSIYRQNKRRRKKNNETGQINYLLHTIHSASPGSERIRSKVWKHWAVPTLLYFSGFQLFFFYNLQIFRHFPQWQEPLDSEVSLSIFFPNYSLRIPKK